MIRKSSNANLGKRTGRIIATATALTFFCQNFAWAVCADGSTFPANGFVSPGPSVAQWPSSRFTGTTESIFIPDNSVFELNDPAQPLTGGGHNWVFDQSKGFCKVQDIGAGSVPPVSWFIPLFNSISEDCTFLPAITMSTGSGSPVPVATELVDSPYQGDAITPTCNPALLSQPGAPNPANTRLNQLGCAISHGVATTPQTASTFVFLAGISGGLFSMELANDTPNGTLVVHSAAGKDATTAFGGLYSDIPLGQKLANAAVSPDGMFAVATSMNRLQSVFACLNPLGDPGDPSLPIPANFSVPPQSQVKCMSVGNNALSTDLTTTFGPDSQPYFGGQPLVSFVNLNTFNSIPGGSAATAWPQCIFNGFSFANPAPTTLMGELQAVFNAHSANHCGSAQLNQGFFLAGVANQQLVPIIRHGSYMYFASVTGQVVQLKVTVDPLSGLSQYVSRFYAVNLLSNSTTTGLGVADDLNSLMIFTNQSITGLPSQEIILKLPLCEDI